MGKYISGLPTDNNLDRWHDYAKGNSYGHNKQQCRAQLDSGGRHGREDSWIPNSDNWQEDQRQSEGCGWTDMKPTGKGGTKRD